MKELARRYRRFAQEEAHGSSPIYESLAFAVSQSESALAFIAGLPSDRQQPNLFFAAVRTVSGMPTGRGHLEHILQQNPQQIRQVMLNRTTQTNEPARCAVLLPLLATLSPPLALLEVGASSGLCLLPDRYGYKYGDKSLMPSDVSKCVTPIFPCEINDVTMTPLVMPKIVWRYGLDLNPLDVTNQHDRDWLETLVWPDQADRLSRLKLAFDVAQQDPPTVVRGNLLTDLKEIAAMAPNKATLVIFHTAVLSYVRSLEDRESFADLAMEVGDVWISNEAPDVLPAIGDGIARPSEGGRFLLAMNGKPMAWSGPHGQSLHWLDRTACR